MNVHLLSSRRCGGAALAGALAMLLGGCSGSTSHVEPGSDVPTAGPAAMPAQAGDAAGGTTVGGDGSGIELAALTAEDIDVAALDGELACSFSAGGAALLLAKGDVGTDAPSRGVVKVGDHAEPVAAPGGFDAMLVGTRFAGAGKTVAIALTGPAIGGGESPARPATLTYDRADGATRSYAGEWQCGP